MAFRANEAKEDGFKKAVQYLLSPKQFKTNEIQDGKYWLNDMVDKWGPVVDQYPCWHPLVATGNTNVYIPPSLPNNDTGYQEIDHTIYLRDAFITCPYSNGNKLMESIDKINFPKFVKVTCEKLDVSLYNEMATPLMVTCSWSNMTTFDQTIPQREAVALMLENELPCWRTAEVAEMWESMRPYFLGQPCGSKSSLFVNPKTGQAMKRAWEAIIFAGVFGPIKVD